MAGALPDLRVHDDRAVEAGHFVGFGRTGGGGEVVVTGDHVAPPGFLDVPLQLDAERAVVPEAVEAAVDFAGLKEESPAFAEGDEFFHFHDSGSGFKFQVSSLTFPSQR